MLALRFGLIDVFASIPLTGNPLAVVLGADELPEPALPRIAMEFNQPETTFVLRPRRGATRRLRSFTAGGSEVVGAGHNALGAWWWLVHRGEVEGDTLRQELGDEVLDVLVARPDGRVVIEMRQGRPCLGAEVAAAELMAPLGLADDDLDGEPARVVSTGAAHLLVCARSRGAVSAAAPDFDALASTCRAAGAQGCYLYATDGRRRAYARFFNPLAGLAEDPATGSAAGPLAWWLTRGDAGPATVEVDQGHALGRPSRITVAVDGDQVTLRGSAVLTAEGDLYIDDEPTEEIT
jgi:trans-2,3-dihydro-3-hydroxyanthranilate isomerase